MISKRRVVIRTCVVCRETGNKRQLVRIVRTPGSEIKLDERGRLPGRGAYVCLKPECWLALGSGHQLEHALRMTLSTEEKASLVAAGQVLIGGC